MGERWTATASPPGGEGAPGTARDKATLTNVPRTVTVDAVLGVIPTVMEAALVAVARKVVILDAHAPASDLLTRAGALGLLLLAIALSWYLLSRANSEFGRVPPLERNDPPTDI